MKVSARPHSFRTSREEPCPASSSFWWLLVFLGLWVKLQSLPLSSLCVYLCPFLCLRLGHNLLLHDLVVILTLITSAETLFPNKDSGRRDLRGDIGQPTMGMLERTLKTLFTQPQICRVVRVGCTPSITGHSSCPAGPSPVPEPVKNLPAMQETQEMLV